MARFTSSIFLANGSLSQSSIVTYTKRLPIESINPFPSFLPEKLKNVDSKKPNILTKNWLFWNCDLKTVKMLLKIDPLFWQLFCSIKVYCLRLAQLPSTKKTVEMLIQKSPKCWPKIDFFWNCDLKTVKMLLKIDSLFWQLFCWPKNWYIFTWKIKVYCLRLAQLSNTKKNSRNDFKTFNSGEKKVIIINQEKLPLDFSIARNPISCCRPTTTSTEKDPYYHTFAFAADYLLTAVFIFLIFQYGLCQLPVIRSRFRQSLELFKQH